MIKIYDLPDKEPFVLENGYYVDIGYIYKSVNVLTIPVWNYDGQIVGMVEHEENRYLEFRPEEVAFLMSKAGAALPQPPYLDFWQRIGGKLFVLGIILFISGNLYLKRRQKLRYRSPAPTVPGRLIDILTQSENFLEINDENTPKDTTLSREGLMFLGVKHYAGSYISVSVIDMSQISVEQAISRRDEDFEQRIALKKAMGSKARGALNYVYYLFSQSPDAEAIAALKKLRKKSIRKRAHFIPGIIDAEQQSVDVVRGATPSRLALMNCFEPAENPEKPVIES